LPNEDISLTAPNILLYSRRSIALGYGTASSGADFGDRKSNAHAPAISQT
jgi:hypothetical protein